MAGSLRAAARQLNMSQPPLSAAIQQLEARLGVALFERSVRGMALTEAGHTLEEEARAILARLEQAETRVRAFGSQPRPLRIGFVSAALNQALPALLRAHLAEGLPQPALREMSTPEQAEALGRGDLDLALLHPPVTLGEGLVAHALGRDPFWAALPDEHPLAGEASVAFSALAAHAFVLFPEAQGPALYGRVRGLAEEEAGAFKVAAEVPRLHSQLALIAGGLGVGLIPASAVPVLRFAGVSYRPLLPEVLDLELHLVGRPHLVAAYAPRVQPSPKASVLAPGRPGRDAG